MVVAGGYYSPMSSFGEKGILRHERADSFLGASIGFVELRLRSIGGIDRALQSFLCGSNSTVRQSSFFAALSFSSYHSLIAALFDVAHAAVHFFRDLCKRGVHAFTK